MTPPSWLHALAWLAVASGVVCALIVSLDIAGGRRQKMWIMNLVWPLTVLWSGVFGLLAYRAFGRAGRGGGDAPFWRSAMLGTLHCGAGCTLGDLVAETFGPLIPLRLFAHRVFDGWLIDYVAAFAFGIAFQYFSIRPMRGLSPGAGLKAALKADAASLSAWQIGMYGWMAIVLFVLFDPQLPKGAPLFWFMMQIAMFAGFCTSYPVNRWLIRAGIKERM